jgi:flagellar motor switch protein FliM
MGMGIGRRRGRGTGRSGPPRPADYPQRYDFEKLPALSRAEFELTQSLYLYLPPTIFEQNFFEMLSQVLTQFMGGPTFVGVHSVQHVPFGAWKQRTPEIGTIAVLSLLPHQSKMALHLDLNLSSFVVDRLTGGPGASPSELRPLTQVEKGVVEFMLLQALAVVDQTFGHMAQVRPRLERFEDSSHGLFDVAQDEDGVLAVTCELVLGSVLAEGGGNASLTFVTGPEEGRSVDLGEEFHDLVVGRSDKANVTVKHGSISREHALLNRSGGVTTVTDLESVNKVFVNDVLVQPRATQQVHNGDVLKLGVISMRYAETERQVIKEERKDFFSICLPYPFLNESLIAPYQGKGLSPLERGFYLNKAQRLCGTQNTTVWAEIGHVNVSASEFEDLQEGDVILLEDASAQKLGDGSYTGNVTLRLGRGEAFGFQGMLLSGAEVLAIQLTDYARQEALGNVAKRL